MDIVKINEEVEAAMKSKTNIPVEAVAGGSRTKPKKIQVRLEILKAENTESIGMMTGGVK